MPVEWQDKNSLFNVALFWTGRFPHQQCPKVVTLLKKSGNSDMMFVSTCRVFVFFQEVQSLGLLAILV